MVDEEVVVDDDGSQGVNTRGNGVVDEVNGTRWRWTVLELWWLLWSIAFALGSFLATNWVEPRIVPFWVMDFRFWRPLRVHGTIPFWAVWFVAVFGYAPSMIVFTWMFMDRTATEVTTRREKRWRVSLFRSCRFIVMMGVAMLQTQAVTEIIKNVVGELRPDFAYRCFGKSSVPYAEKLPFVIQSDQQCSEIASSLGFAASGLRDGRRSFPSGHASVSVASGVFASLFLASQTFRMKSEPCRPGSRSIPSLGVQGIRTCLQLLSTVPMFFATVVSISRLIDNRHHPVDVTGGALLGTSISLFFFWMTVFISKKEENRSKD